MFSEAATKIITIIAILGAIITGVGYYGHSRYKSGQMDERSLWEQRLRESENRAKNETERLQKLANDASISQDYYAEQLNKSRNAEKKLRASLSVADNCAVPAATVRVLNDATNPNLPKNAGSTSEPSPTTVTADSTLADQLAICVRNYQERYEPLAEQTRALQKLWIDTQAVINSHNLTP